MKCLIHELFSGVGLCNQLFSFETAIYLANISNRKLILLIKNPLCHCGKASWNYGYFLNFFTNDFLKYLPNGFECYYKQFPIHIKNILNDEKKTKKIKYKGSFSNIVFVDTSDNDVSEFCHWRKEESLQFKENDNYDYLYITQSNASRCFYNFYTNENNYKLMYNICKSIKFKQIFYDIANTIFSSLLTKKNQYNIFFHFRFGDRHKDKKFIERYNSCIQKNVFPYLDGHITNMIRPNIYIMCDNMKNTEFLKKINKYKPVYIETLTKNYIQNFFDNNKMLFYNFNKIIDYSVATAIVEMLLCTKADAFVGTISSTFSHYIQYLRYCDNKTYNNYSNINQTNSEFCKLRPVKKSKIEWIKYNFKGGHPVSWHRFWDLKQKKNKILMTIRGKTDGFGSQLQAIFSLIAYCNYKGYTYVHTPLYRMHHNDENIPNFPSYMNKFINIEHKFQTVDSLSNYEKSIVHNVKEGPFIHGSLHPEYFYNDYILNLLQEIYFSSSKPNLLYNKNTNNIAVHIRRGDVNPQKYPSRFISNQTYIDLIKKLDLNNSTIHIFSEGKDSDFCDIVKSFPKTSFVMHLNENIQLTFHYLVMADVLILSKSSFSYCAALINNNVIVANLITRWWHKPLRSWQIV